MQLEGELPEANTYFIFSPSVLGRVLGVFVLFCYFSECIIGGRQLKVWNEIWRVVK